MAEDAVLTEKRGRVLLITLNRPEQMGAMTSQMRDDIVDAIYAARDDLDVRVLVITGKGKGFCTGADLSGGAPPTPWVGRTRFTMRTGSQKLLRAIWEVVLLRWDSPWIAPACAGSSANPNASPQRSHIVSSARLNPGCHEAVQIAARRQREYAGATTQ